MKFIVKSMSCHHCVNAITQAIKALDPNSSIATNLESKEVAVHGSFLPQQVLEAIQEAGYADATLV